MTINRPTLGGAFSGSPAPDRGAGLGDLLPPPKKPAEKKPDAESANKPTKTAAPNPRKTPVRNVADAAEGDAVSNVGVYLEPEVLDAVKKQRRAGRAPGETDRQYDEILVDALGRVSLEELSAKFRIPLESDTNSLLPPRKRRPQGISGVQIQPRLSRSQKETLDDLIQQTGAPSRSALISAAFRLAYLND